MPSALIFCYQMLYQYCDTLSSGLLVPLFTIETKWDCQSVQNLEMSCFCVPSKNSTCGIMQKVPMHQFYAMLILQKKCCCEEESVTRKTVFKVTDRVKHCSDWLSDFVEKLCSKVFSVVKRDTSASLMDRLVPEGLQEHLYKQRLLTSEPWRRVRRQIATECCEQACTVANIILYCPDEARLVKENPDIFYDD